MDSRGCIRSLSRCDIYSVVRVDLKRPIGSQNLTGGRHFAGTYIVTF